MDFISERLKPDEGGEVRPLSSIVEEVRPQKRFLHPKLLWLHYIWFEMFLGFFVRSCWTIVWLPTHLETVQDVTTWPASLSHSSHTPLSRRTQRRGRFRRRRKRRTRTTIMAKRQKLIKEGVNLSQMGYCVPHCSRYSRDAFCPNLNPYLINKVSPWSRHHKDWMCSKVHWSRIISIVLCVLFLVIFFRR